MHKLFLIALLIPAAGLGQSGIYDGKVYGIFDPLKVAEDTKSITVTGGTFRYGIDRATGQIVSARALEDEFVAAGTSFPNPYIGVMPQDDPGARREGGKERPRFGYEKAAEIRPRLWSGDLTDSARFDAAGGTGIRTEVVSAAPEAVTVRAAGAYAGTSLSWQVDYDFDVDGFTKVTVSLSTTKPVQLRWSCFNHAFLSKDAVRFLTKVSDPASLPLTVHPEPTVSIGDIQADNPVLESHWNAFFHLSNRVTGIEFSKQDFTNRWSGYRDSEVKLENGETWDTGAVKTADGRTLQGYDSRGRVNMFTQLYMRAKALELEEFDIRNATYPLNPGEVRKRVFWVQLTPAKHPRNDLNSIRAVWPGPHQIVMARWRGTTGPWQPPSDEQVKLWAQMGVNLIVGGANYWSGDYGLPLEPEKTRHFIETVHRYGMRVIPYVTLADFNFAAPGYQEHAAEWMASAGIEFANETTLMCYNAKGWRDFVEKQWDALLASFDFDGLYIDHWIDTRFCNNARHGCGGYLGSFATEGYHDFARRARQVVARHTKGRGVMLLNANMLLFSGVVPWFDIRLNGENDDPLKMREETIATTWNGWGQGVQSFAMWRESQDSRSMMNLMTTYMIPFELARRPKTLADWETARTPELELAREFWGYWRFFGLNGARKFSSFDHRDVLDATQAGTIVNGFARDGRVLVVLGVQGGSGTRQETLKVLSTSRLGLQEGVRYRIVDLRHNRYLTAGSYSAGDLSHVPVTLSGAEPAVLLIEPAKQGPRLAYFSGADRVTASDSGSRLELRVEAVPGSPLELHVDEAGTPFHPETAGFTRLAHDGDFAVFAGPAPEDGVVKLTR